MRILHTADWHLGKRLDGFSRSEEQREVLQEICEIAEREQADAVIIAGDLFDTFNPPTEATELFYKTVKRLACNGKRPVIAIAGNHDSPDRIEAPDPLARECGIIFAGYPHSVVHPFSLDCDLHVTRSEPGFMELQLPGSAVPLRLLLTPYANEFRLRTYFGDEEETELCHVLGARWHSLADTYCDEQGVNLLVAHLYMMKKGSVPPEEPEDERSILHIGGAQAVYSENVPAQMQYVALGHLHRQQVIDNQPCPVVYSSSPLAYSFSEANQTKYVMLIELQPGQPADYRAIPLAKGKKLLRKRFEVVDEAVSWLQENPGVLLELTIATDTFLTAAERKQLYSAHDGIVTLIPEVKNADKQAAQRLARIDLSKGIEELFTEYFKFKHTQEPNERLIDLFKEALATDADSRTDEE